MKDNAFNADPMPVLQLCGYSPASSPAFWFPDRLQEPAAWVEHIPFAFWIVEVAQPRVLVELGTHSGNSYLAFCQAVKRLGLPTACYGVDTWKGDDQAGHYDKSVYTDLSKYHSRYAEFSQLIRSTFDEAAGHFVNGSIDLLHIDGCHNYDAVKHDFETWRPKLAPDALVLMHDTNVHDAGFDVHALWHELRDKHPSFSFLHSNGLGVLAMGKIVDIRVRSLFESSGNEENSAAIRMWFARLGHGIRLQLVSDVQEHSIAELLKEKQAIIDQFHQSSKEQYDAIRKRDTQLELALTDASALRETISEIRNSRSWRLARKLVRLKSIITGGN